MMSDLSIDQCVVIRQLSECKLDNAYYKPLNLLFPIATPDDLVNGIKTVQISSPEGSIMAYVIDSKFILDGVLAYSAESYTLDTMYDIITILSDYMITSKYKFIEELKKYSVNKETYVWNQLSNKIEYSYYQFKKRKWPIKKESNIDWQTIANELKLINKVYPGDTKARTRNFDDVKLDPHMEQDQTKVADAKEHPINIECDSSDDDNEILDETMLVLPRDKERHIKRVEKLRILRLNSNYSVYGIPDIKAVEARYNLCDKTVLQIYDSITNLGQLLESIVFACNLIVSRKFFHLVIKNPPFMKRIDDVMKNHPRIRKFIKYVMHYAFYMLGKEERLLGRKIMPDSRCIMTADQFRSLPIFDCGPDDSPYVSEIYNKEFHNTIRNMTPFHLHGRRRFTDGKVFLERLNEITGSMLTGIDLSEHKAFLTGSSLVPCIATNPLEDNFSSRDDPFNAYIECLYPSYDSIKQYQENYEIKKCETWDAYLNSGLSKDILNECFNHFNNDDDFILALKGIVIDSLDSTLLHRLCGELIDRFEQLIYMETKLSDLDIAVIAHTRVEYENSVNALYEKIRINVINKFGDDYSHRVYLFKQPLKYGFKYVLKGPGAKRPIDFFRITCEPHTLTYRFHVNVVRFWYDGKQLSGLASGICAALTGINQWYKWFSNNKDPIDIVLKNIQRGYTTMLNMEEIRVMKEYIKHVDKYAYLRQSIVVGHINRTHTVFENSGGIRYQLPFITVCEKNNDAEEYVPVANNAINGCVLDIVGNGIIIPPKIYAFRDIISDMLD